MSGTAQVLSIEELTPGTLWALPDLPSDHTPGSIIELVDEPIEYAVRPEGEVAIAHFRVLFGSVPFWWRFGNKDTFTLTIPLTEGALDEVLFTPIPIKEYIIGDQAGLKY